MARRTSAATAAAVASQPVQFRLRIAGEDEAASLGYNLDMSLVVVPLRVFVPLHKLQQILAWVEGFLPPLLWAITCATLPLQRFSGPLDRARTDPATCPSFLRRLVSSLPPGEPELVIEQPPGLPPIKFQFVVESLVAVLPSSRAPRSARNQRQSLDSQPSSHDAQPHAE